MIQSIKFRLYPTVSQASNLHEIFTIYNKVKRVGYNLYYGLRDANLSKNDKRKIVQPHLMELCHNNPYVNSILIDCETKLSQQEAWLEKRERFLTNQIETIKKKIAWIVEKDTKNRRLKGLYSRLSSAENKLLTLQFKPVVFGTKRLFRERLLRKKSKDEFRIRRDSSFCCVGKKTGVNLNLKLLPDMVLKVRTFSKEKGKKWLLIPFTVNYTQEKWFTEILDMELYQVEVIRRFYKGRVRYFAHVSYESPEEEPIHGFEKGAIGLDMNYNFVSLSNVDIQGNFKSFHEIPFRN